MNQGAKNGPAYNHSLWPIWRIGDEPLQLSALQWWRSWSSKWASFCQGHRSLKLYFIASLRFTDKFTELCNRPHNPVLGHFHHFSKDPSSVFTVNSYCNQLHNQEAPFYLCRLTCFGSHKWIIQHVIFYVCLPLSNMSLRVMHIVACVLHSFLLMNRIPLCGCTTSCLAIHRLVDIRIVSTFGLLDVKLP